MFKDIHAEMKRLENEGFQLINKEPKRGADNKLVCFSIQKLTNGVLIELCQESSVLKIQNPKLSTLFPSNFLLPFNLTL